MEITFSDGSSLSVLQEVFLDLGLHQGDALDHGSLERIKRLSTMREIQHKALDLLSRAPHSTRSLELKLIKRGFDRAAVREILERLAGRGYLDDRRFCQEWLQVHLLRHPEGRSALISDLIRHGISRSLAEEVVSESIDPAGEAENARKLAERLMRRGPLPPEILRARLHARGFTGSVIRTLLEELKDERGEGAGAADMEEGDSFT